MKAIHCTTYGSPEKLQLVEVDKPMPNDDDVLVKVHAASLNISDCYSLQGGPTRLFNGLLRPKEIKVGSDLAGEVESTGRSVTHFHPGDNVFGTCPGSFAEYASAKEKRLALIPANVSFEQAAAVPVAAITALQGLRDAGRIQPGQQVLINGASGGVGTFAVQIAKAFGAEVTAVCSTPHLGTARSVGADHVIDYTCQDFTRSGQKYDLILAVNGYHSLWAYKRALNPKGTYVMAGASGPRVLWALLEVALFGRLLSRSMAQKLTFMGFAKINQNDLVILSDLLAAQKIMPVIDRRYPLSQAAEAFSYLGLGHAGGKIIINVGSNGKD